MEEWIKFLDQYIKTTIILLCRELKAKSKLKRRNFEDILEDHKYPFQVYFYLINNNKIFIIIAMVSDFLGDNYCVSPLLVRRNEFPQN